jgi:hypothetical protein
MQRIERETLLVLRERHVATTTAPGSVMEHCMTLLKWSPNQRYVATLSVSPRVRLWNVTEGLKGQQSVGEGHGNNGECVVTLHGHLR